MKGFSLIVLYYPELVLVLLNFKLFQVHGHSVTKPPIKQTNPDGKCGMPSNIPPPNQIGKMLFHPCNKEKVTIRCPLFLTSRCKNGKQGNTTLPFTFKVVDMVDEILVILERQVGVNFLQFFVEARRVEDGKAVGKRFGRFFDRLDDGRAPLRTTKSQCHEDVCCRFKYIPDVATYCQRPWMGPYTKVGEVWTGTVDQFSWQIPEGFYGEVVFIGTFVTSVDRYFPDVHSNILSIEKPGRVNPRIGYLEKSQWKIAPVT